jgi:DNA repair protein RecO (recombination protein O)
MYLTVQALVLRVTNYNDTDALLTLLTKNQGKITVKARGLRRKNSPLAAPCQVLSYAEFTLFEYRNQYTINEAHSIELFQGLRKELQRFSLGTYFLQVVETIALEDAPNPELLSLVLNSLYMLTQESASEKLVKAVFELRATCLAGYTPNLEQCYICGDRSPHLFNTKEGHLVCRGCDDGTEFGIRLPISQGVLAAMRYVCQCDPKKLFSFSINEESLDLFCQASESYLIAQLEKSFSTLDFYKRLIYGGLDLLGE